MNISKSAVSTSFSVLAYEIYQLKEKIKMFSGFESDHSELINLYENQIIELRTVIDFLNSQNSI